MAFSKPAGMKKNKIPKNKKKSWKNIDITEVEDVLEDERLQERTGGLVAEKTDEQLFVVDKAKASDIVEEVNLRSRRRLQKPLKCFAHLEPNPNIKPSRIAHNIRKETEDTKKLNRKRTKTDIQASKQRKQRIIQRKQEKIANKRLNVANYDLWQDNSDDVDNDEPHLKKRKVKTPKHYYEKTSGVSAIEIPHPGSSYNPSYEDHQNLLATATITEVKKTKAEERLYKSLEAKFKTVSKEALEETLLSEMNAGLYDDDENNNEEEFTEEELTKISVNPPVRREDKKTKTQRNKEERAKALEKLKKKSKVSKSQDSQIHRLKSIKAELKKKELEAAKKAAKVEERRKEQTYKTRKLGKVKFEEPALDLKLSDELEGSLRLLKPEGHLLQDRYKSLQKRNIIEPRVKAKKQRKYKPKSFEKKGHKEISTT